MHRASRLPAPLPCAVIVAAAIAVAGSPPPTRPPATTADDRVDDTVVGTVGAPIMTTPRGRGAPLHTGPTTVWLWTTAAIAPGQRIRAVGRLRAPRGFLAPGSPDRAIFAASRGAEWELDARTVTVLADDPDLVARLWRWAAAVQAELGARIGPAPADGGDEPPRARRGTDATDETDAGDATDNREARRGDVAGRAFGAGGFGAAVGAVRATATENDAAARAALRGIVTGDRSRIPPDLDERWRVLGIYHVLSVSGLHLAVIAGLAFALLRRLIAASPWGGRTRPARWAAPPALALAVAYTLVTGGQLATVRALVVVAIVLLAQMLDRPVRLVDALGVAAIAILAWRPQDLHDASFQLSFVAALTLALRPPAPVALGSVRSRVWAALRRGLATSAWVALTTAPITALHFQQIAIGGVLGNLVLTPVVELAALPLGLAGALAGDVGAPLVTVAVWLVEVVDHLAAAIAPVVPVGAVAIASPLLVAALVACSLLLAARAHRTRVDVAAWTLLCISWALGRTPPPLGALRVTFLDVGQGDAAIVELPGGGGVWLVDAGGLASARDLTSASAPGDAISRTLAVYGHDAIDLAIISHPHPDHYLGLARVGVPIRELWSTEPARAGGPRTFGTLAAVLALRGTEIATPALGAVRTRSGVELAVWAPRYREREDGPEVLGADPVRSVNDNSLVVAVSYAGRTLLFAGDLEAEGEEALVAAGLPPVDVVKVAHHGSPTSSSPAFVAATQPALAVISCGVGNTFGFPAASVVARWRGAGADVARTDTEGSITVTIGADGALDVARYRRPRP